MNIMDDEMFITHLLNSLPQAEYEGAILVIKERLRSRSCNLAEVEQLLKDKYLSMKYVKSWEEEEDDYALFASPDKKKGLKKQFKGQCGYCGEIGHKAANCPNKKSKQKEDSKDKSDKKEAQKPKRTVKERARLICQKLNVIIVENWVISLETAQSHAKTLILLEKMSKTGNSPN